MLHIVSFNVPYPANYGGVIDVFYRLKALKSLGLEIHLHAFEYGRGEQEALRDYCSEITYYPRMTGLRSAFSRRPYIVQSRASDQLITNLRKDDSPILLEGLHCCSVLEQINDRKILVRAHNVEHDYYARLAAAEPHLPRRIYLRTDARRLRRYEPILTKASAVLAVTKSDLVHFQNIGCRNVLLMPSSHPDDEVVSIPGRGDFILYHGDLSVAENVKTVTFLATNIIPRIPYKVVVAGRNPSPTLTSLLARFGNVELVANPDDSQMHGFISQAHVSLLLTDQPTGLKLKLLNSLFAGRHCLVNSAMVSGTELGQLCTVADTTDDMLHALADLMATPFSQSDIERRSLLLGTLYSNAANAKLLVSLL